MPSGWLTRLVENEVQSLPEDFLAHHQSMPPLYRGMRVLSWRRTNIHRLRRAPSPCWIGSPPAAPPDLHPDAFGDRR